MTHPVDSLMSDHRLIEQVLEALESRLAAMQGEPFPRRFFDHNILFQIARRVLGPADVDRLRTGFTALDERLAAGGYRCYQEPAARPAQGGEP